MKVNSENKKKNKTTRKNYVKRVLSVNADVGNNCEDISLKECHQ